MIDRLYTPQQVAEILQVSVRTAYNVMHQMQHMEKPFRVAESALWAWMQRKTMAPAETPRKRQKREIRPVSGDWHIPRRRAGA